MFCLDWYSIDDSFKYYFECFVSFGVNYLDFLWIIIKIKRLKVMRIVYCILFMFLKCYFSLKCYYYNI